MQRIILSYGILSGLVVIVTTIIGISFSLENEAFEFSQWLGYLVMLVALSMIFVGMKRYRDNEQGGVISFARGMQLGLGIAAVAGVMYVTVWELYLVLTDYAFINDYAQATIDARRAAGATTDELARLTADMDTMKAQYANPLFRIPITFLEIFPVGLLVSLLSAAVLRKSEILPVES